MKNLLQDGSEEDACVYSANVYEGCLYIHEDEY